MLIREMNFKTSIIFPLLFIFLPLPQVFGHATPSDSLTASVFNRLSDLYSMEQEYDHLSGVVLINAGGNTIYHQAFGQANRKSLNLLETRFDIGSISKQFTAAAILQLVHEGRFDLQDKINPLLEEQASKRWKNVTVHQLLTHTSGIPSLYQTEQGIPLVHPKEESVTASELINNFKDSKLLFRPGNEFSYSNSGYLLLAEIIEKTSGQDFFTYMEENIFAKYGLSKTSFKRNDQSASPFYGYRTDLLRQAPVYDPSWMKGSGGIYSIAEDLLKWNKIIHSDQFLSSSLRKEFSSKHTQQGYGYGWQFSAEGKMQHDGGNAGFISYYSIDRKTKDQVIILTNRSYEDIHKFGKSANYVLSLVEKSWAILDNKEVEILPKATSIDNEKIGGSEQYGTIQIDFTNTNFINISSEKLQPSRIIYNTALSQKESSKLSSIAELLKQRKFSRLAKYCDAEMKFICRSGMMKIGINSITKKIGGYHDVIPYHEEENHGLLRLKGEEGVLDLIVYYDKSDNIIGIFENGLHDLDKGQTMRAYPIGDNKYFIDGLPYAEEDTIIGILDQSISLEKTWRKIVLKR